MKWLLRNVSAAALLVGLAGSAHAQVGPYNPVSTLKGTEMFQFIPSGPSYGYINTTNLGLTMGTFLPAPMAASVPFIPTPFVGGSTLQQSIFIGIGAGVLYPTTADIGYGSTAVGSYALANLTTTSSENVAVGSDAAYSYNGNTAVSVGMHSLGSQVTGSHITAVGSDAMSRTVSADSAGSTAIGGTAMVSGGPGPNQTAVGIASLAGNSTSLILGGSVTTGDTLSVAMTASGVTGLPLTVTATAVGGDTLATLATRLSQAFIAIQTTIFVPQTGIFKTDAPQLLPDGNYVIRLSFPGTGSTGWGITFTPSVSGAASETLTAGAGCVSGGNSVLGADTLQGQACTNVIFNAGVGSFGLQFATTAANNSFNGYSALQNCETCARNVAVGTSAGTAEVAGTGNVFLGYNAGSTSTGNSNIVIGPNQATLLAGSSNELNIGGLFFGHLNGGGVPTVVCSGASPTVDTNATPHMGTITVGSGTVTSCSVTFAVAYSSFNHCLVSQHTAVASPTYSYTLAALTVGGTSLTNAVFDYNCEGY